MSRLKGRASPLSRGSPDSGKNCGNLTKTVVVSHYEETSNTSAAFDPDSVIAALNIYPVGLAVT